MIGWYETLTLTREITIHADGTIEFRNALRRTVLTPRDIAYVKVTETEGGMTHDILHLGGRIHVPHQMGDISEFLTYLTTQNPQIEVVDRWKKMPYGDMRRRV